MNRINGDKLLIFIEIIAVLLIAVLGVHKFIVPTKEMGKKLLNTEYSDLIDEPIEEIKETENIETEVVYEFPETVMAKVNSMTVEEKVCQLFLTRPEEITGVSQFTAAGKKTKNAINTYPLGGFVFDKPNFGGVAATQTIMANIQSYEAERIGILSFMAVNEAGGDNSPLATANALEVANSPMDQADATAAGEAAKRIASNIGQNGLNMNVNAYSGDADKLAAVLAGYKEAQVKSVVGTFPGEGIADMTATDIQYLKAVESGVSVVMVASYPCQLLTGDPEKACIVSSDVISYLKKNLKFQGVIMTDDLSKGVSGGKSQDEAAVEAVKAGVNILYVTTGFEGSYNAVVDAVNNGDISQDVLNESVARILVVKGM